MCRCSQRSGYLCHWWHESPETSTPVPGMLPAPIEPADVAPKPVAGSNGEVSVAKKRPPGPRTLAITEPFAVPPETAALSEPWAPTPLAPWMRNTPATRPSPLVVSTRLSARIVKVPLRRGSLLVEVPVYVASVVANVSPPLTVHVVSRAFWTVAAVNDADTGCAFVWNPPASATPAATRAATTNGATSKSRFLDMWSPGVERAIRSLTPW